MLDVQKKNLAVPTNIITGFLGVGKTTAILHLLKQKPKQERWAVLVNEFGEIGIDGCVMEGAKDDQGIFIKEVAGGCMCCTAGLSMQIALNLLLAKAKPDRLLIEPTGLGHPAKVIRTLSAEHYCDVLSLHKTITLVDATKLVNARYTQHDIFNQQIEVADVVVGNKSDLYSDEDACRLSRYVKKHGQVNASVCLSKHGQLSLSILEGQAISPDILANKESHSSHHHFTEPAGEEPLGKSTFLKASGQGEGYHSVGWRFSTDVIFCRDKLLLVLKGANADRMKGVFNTDKGVYCYNSVEHSFDEKALSVGGESRIEIIATHLESDFESCLFDCIQP